MLKIIFPCIAVIGLLLVIRSVRWLTKTYNSDQQEFAAKQSQASLSLLAGDYELDVKRPSMVGIISFRSTFRITAENDGQNIPVVASGNIFAGRKNMSGDRIVPVAHFTIIQPGNYKFTNEDTAGFQDRDRIIIMPKTGFKGVLSILATVFSGLLFLGGLVLSILTLKGKI